MSSSLSHNLRLARKVVRVLSPSASVASQRGIVVPAYNGSSKKGTGLRTFSSCLTRRGLYAQTPTMRVDSNDTPQKSDRRLLSFYNNDNYTRGGGDGSPNMGNAIYTVYGEEFAFSIKAIPPEFRALPSGTVILDASKRGRLLFEWTPMDTAGYDHGNGNRKYRWDASTRFALTAEEAASLLARLDRGDSSVEMSRRVPGDHYQNPIGRPLDKLFVAKPIGLEDDAKKNNGVCLMVDYVDPDNHQFGQIPHPSPGDNGGGFENDGFRGPFEINLMIGEYQIVRSIIEYSIPKLVGWSTMFDRNIEQAITKSQSANNNNNNRGGYGGGKSPHNYQ